MLESLFGAGFDGIDFQLNLTSILQIIAAAGALGTAAFGLVDVSKVVRWGLPSVGLRRLKRSFARFDATLTAALPGDDWREVMAIFWISGLPKDEQKGKMRALLRLGLSSRKDVIQEMARIGGVTQERLGEVAAKLERGAALNEEDLNVIGRVDAAVVAFIDAAYERADFEYRNAARATAAAVSVLLGAAGGFLVFGPTSDIWFAAAIGLVAVPLAPIAKDLSTSLTRAVDAARAIRGR